MSFISFIRPAAAYASNTIWSSSAVPTTASYPDTRSVELGVKFKSDVNGYITGLRFYKGSANTGTHIGHLWTSTGTLLAAATFTNETASGWQQVSFATPVAITANTVYVASYYAPNGGYSVDRPYFTSSYDNAPLHALADGTSGSNGVHYYPGNAFPTVGYDQSNYWVDVVFTTTVSTSNTIWSNSAIPATASYNSGTNSVEVGVKFRSDISGYITGLRFYKGTANTGTHIGHLWTSTGTLLAAATFTNETASGWQQMNLTTPVAITANTVYIASYCAPNGGYSVDRYYFTSSRDNAPLHALADGTSGPNGVHLFPGNSFPTEGYEQTNYWVDVVFSPSSSGSSSTLGVINASPSSGPTAGGTVVTLTGSNFQSGATVNFGGTNSTAVSFISATQLNAIAPAHSAGIVDLTVTNPNGTPATLSGAFTYTASPTIGTISPSSGPTTGGTTVTISGSGFKSGAAVTFGMAFAASVVVNSSTQIQAITPSEAAGAVSVVVTNSDGGTATRSSAFTFQASGSPTIASVSPNSGTSGITVAITGSNFESGATVKFGTNASPSVTWVSASQLNAVVPTGAVGTSVSVSITNPDPGTATLANGFSYRGGQGLLTGMTPAHYTVPTGWKLYTTQDFESTIPSGQGINHSSITTNNPHSGGHSLQGTYTYGSENIGWFINEGSGLGREYYVSWYEYDDSGARLNDEMFLLNVQRHFPMNNGSQLASILFDWFSNDTPVFNDTTGRPVMEVQYTGGAHTFYFGSAPFNTGAWVQWEAHIRANDPNMSNGEFELYRNGVLFEQATSVNLNGPWDMTGTGLEVGGDYTKITWSLSPTSLVCSNLLGNAYNYNYPQFNQLPCPNQGPPGGVVPSFNRYFDDIIVLMK